MMHLTFLGTGGACSMPRPGCHCMNCDRARREGVPYARNGSSLYAWSDGVLLDMPENVSLQLEAAKIDTVNAIMLTHWHHDHVGGLRYIEHRGHAYPDAEKPAPVDVYIPVNDIAMFEKHWASFWFYQQQGFCRLMAYDDHVPIELATSTITPVDFHRGPKRVRYGFLIEENGKRVMYAPCSIFEAELDKYWRDLDVLIIETGWYDEYRSIAEVRESLPDGHGWHDHVSFEETMAMVKELAPKKTVLTHLDGTRHLLACGDYDAVLGRATRYNMNVTVAYDFMNLIL